MYKDLMGRSNVFFDIIGFLMVKEIFNLEFYFLVEEEVLSFELVLEVVKITEKVVKIIDDFKLKKKFLFEKEVVLDVRILEEILVFFLVKLIKLLSVLSKDVKNLLKFELKNIVFELVKFVVVEIFRNNISIVIVNFEEKFLSLESIEMIF